MKKNLLNIIVCCLGFSLGFVVLYSCGLFPSPSGTGHQAQVITIAGDGSLSIAGTQMDLSQLTASLKKEKTPGFTVTIQAGANTDYKRVQEVVNACKSAGVTKVSLRTSTKP